MTNDYNDFPDSELTDKFYSFSVPQERNGNRLDAFLCTVSELSRSRISALIDDSRVFVNGYAEKKSYKVKTGDSVELICPPPADIEAKPEDIPLDIVYEDDDLLVVNKARGMVVHPAPGNYNGTLVNALLWHCRDSLSGINGKIRPGIVHRIDKNTSGLLIVAKNDTAHIGLAEQIKNHSFERKYQALIYGAPDSEEGRIDYPIGRSLKDRKKMAAFNEATPNTKDAHTLYRVLKHFNGYSLVEVTLLTGRTHQIRVHFSRIGHPVVGDDLYAVNRKDFGLKGQCLHAMTIGFVHPMTGQKMYFTSPLPDYFKETISKIEKL